MQFDDLNKEINYNKFSNYQQKYPNQDDMFTNKDELEYPLETDFVNIKVLNNNTKLLNEKKADISNIEASLKGIAKERSEYSIEDKVKNLEDNVNSLLNMGVFDYDYIIECMRYPKLEMNKEIILSEINGSGYIYNFYTIPRWGDLKLKLQVDDKIICNFNITVGQINNLSKRVGFITRKNIMGYMKQEQSEYFPNLYAPYIQYYGAWKLNGNLLGNYTDRMLQLIPYKYFYPLSENETKISISNSTVFSNLITLLAQPIRFEKNIKVIVERTRNDYNIDFADVEIHYKLDKE